MFAFVNKGLPCPPLRQLFQHSPSWKEDMIDLMGWYIHSTCSHIMATKQKWHVIYEDCKRSWADISIVLTSWKQTITTRHSRSVKKSFHHQHYHAEDILQEIGVREKVENKLCDLHLAPTICHLHTWDTDVGDECDLEIEKKWLAQIKWQHQLEPWAV